MSTFSLNILLLSDTLEIVESNAINAIKNGQYYSVYIICNQFFIDCDSWIFIWSLLFWKAFDRVQSNLPWACSPISLFQMWLTLLGPSTGILTLQQLCSMHCFQLNPILLMNYEIFKSMISCIPLQIISKISLGIQTNTCEVEQRVRFLNCAVWKSYQFIFSIPKVQPLECYSIHIHNMTPFAEANDNWIVVAVRYFTHHAVKISRR